MFGDRLSTGIALVAFGVCHLSLVCSLYCGPAHCFSCLFFLPVARVPYRFFFARWRAVGEAGGLWLVRFLFFFFSAIDAKKNRAPLRKCEGENVFCPRQKRMPAAALRFLERTRPSWSFFSACARPCLNLSLSRVFCAPTKGMHRNRQEMISLTGPDGTTTVPHF